MVYLTKVFSDLQAKSCPLMTEITANAANFNQQLTFYDDCDCNNGCGNSCGCGCNCNCGCGCGTNNIEIDEDANFAIETTQVIVSDFDLVCPHELEPCNVTVDGMPVDGLDFFNERYMAGTNDLMTRISDCTCMERGLPTKGYFLICNAGPWKAKLTIAVTGTVFGCGGSKRFKLCMTTKNEVFVNIPGTSTFAASSICLPCTTGGIAPVINFSFGAEGSLLNPCLTADPCGQCNLMLTGCLVVEPEVDVQVTRQTLFRTSAETVNVPCDDIARCRTCGDDNGNVVAVTNKCCGPDHGHDHECGCGCDDDCRPEVPACGCCGTTTTTGNSGCGGNSRNSGRSISCQFNGYNGCNF